LVVKSLVHFGSGLSGLGGGCVKIRGTRIVLRDERRDADGEDLFRWLNLEEWSYYDEPDKPFESISRKEFEERRRRPGKPAPHSHNWQIDTIEGRHIGWVNYYHLDEQAKHAYVGICLPEEEMWGKGYGTEAVSLLVDHLFGEMGLKEVRTATWTGNERMMRCAAKSGFKEIGRMPHRAEYSVRGEPLKRIEFSISRAEWSAQRSGGG
jgi:RimJ/RimL family protein N-acetyltransferase